MALAAVVTLLACLQVTIAAPAGAATASSTTTQLTSSLVGPVSAVAGQKLTFTATVRSGTATPGGTVVFSEGTTILGSTTLFFGRYVFAIGSLAVGTHRITATYVSGASYAASAASVSVKVVPASTTTGLAASPTPSVAGQAVTLSATVTAVAPSTGAPVGTVTFYDGATPIGSAWLYFNKYVLVTTTLRAGSHQVTARFTGNLTYLASTSAASPVTVAPILWITPPGPGEYGYYPQAIPPYAGSGPTIGLLGDSITYYDAESFRAAATAAGLAPAVTGMPGYQLAGVDPWLDLYAATVPDVMVVNLGTNDASGDAKGYPNFSLDLFRQRLDLAAARFPQSCLVVTTLTTHRTLAKSNPATDGYTPDAWNAITSSYNEHVRSAFAHVADWDALLAVHPEYAPDEVHPVGSAAGLAALASLQIDAARTCP